MNNYHNFHMPEFQTKYGSDWDGFIEEINDLYDYIFQNIFDLYRLSQLDRMSNRVVKANLDVMDIRYKTTDTNKYKKEKLRSYPEINYNKGLRQIYNDLIKIITGTDSIFLSSFGEKRWGVQRWDAKRWTEAGYQFSIYIDVLTSVVAKIDAIEIALKNKEVKPAFYVLYIFDSTGTGEILRVIN